MTIRQTAAIRQFIEKHGNYSTEGCAELPGHFREPFPEKYYKFTCQFRPDQCPGDGITFLFDETITFSANFCKTFLNKSYR